MTSAWAAPDPEGCILVEVAGGWHVDWADGLYPSLAEGLADCNPGRAARVFALRRVTAEAQALA